MKSSQSATPGKAMLRRSLVLPTYSDTKEGPYLPKWQGAGCDNDNEGSESSGGGGTGQPVVTIGSGNCGNITAESMTAAEEAIVASVGCVSNPTGGVSGGNTITADVNVPFVEEERRMC